MNLKKEIIKIAKKMGAHKIGFTSYEILKGSPDTTDLRYVLPNAQSAISICIAFDKYPIRAFLSKQDQWPHASEHVMIKFKLNFIAEVLTNFLKEQGFDAISRPFPNYEFRKGQHLRAQLPPISHKYIAVAAGIGWLGWSNLVITPEYGAPVLLSTVLTNAEIEPDNAITQEDWCEDCKLCVYSCPTQYISKKEKEEVTIAGYVYKRNKTRAYIRCVVCCGGATGVADKNSRWSSWSPYVLEFPETDDDKMFEQRALEYAKNPDNIRLKWALDLVKGHGIDTREGFDHTALTDYWCCGFCHLICWPKKEDRLKNYRILRNSGRMIKKDHYILPKVRRKDPFLPRINVQNISNNIGNKEKSKLYDF